MRLFNRFTFLLVIGGAFACAQTGPALVPDWLRRIGPHDQVMATTREDGSTRITTYEVREDGYIVVPLIGRMQAAGLTVDELKRVMAQKLANAQVSVSFKQPALLLQLDFIQPHDLVAVRMGESDATKTSTYRVSDDGYIAVPLLGSIKAAGLTAGELERIVLQKCNDAKLFSEPKVSITIQQHMFILEPEDVLVVSTGASQPFGYEVRSDGYIVFPLIGEIKAAGLTIDELTQEIIDKLKAVHTDLDPKVTVSLIQFTRANHR